MTFEADSIAITDLLPGNKKYFVPAYQRPYRWDPEKAEQLAQDIYESFCSAEEPYFIGSMICVKTGDREFEVVDGQQRLITLTLIVLELARLMEDDDARIFLKSMVVQTDPLSANSKSVPSLRVRKPENNFYWDRIVNGNDGATGVLTSNQKVFLNNQEQIAKYFAVLDMGQANIKKFAAYLRDKVFVVFVQAGDRASSFRLFNVLNHRGMPLNDADLLKNHLLSRVADDEQTSEKVEKNWLDMEMLVGDEKLNNFLSWHQVSEKQDRNRVKKRNFAYYESRLRQDDFCGDAAAMSGMLLRGAENYDAILNGICGAARTVAFLDSLSRTEEWIPAFIAFLDKEYLRENFSQFAELFEKTYMHSLLGGDAKSKREAVCYHAVEAINQGKPFEEIMACVRDLADTRRLDESLDAKDFYDDSRPVVINLVKSVLLRINEERHDNSARLVYPDRRKITVEHIMPRKIGDLYWQKRFSAEQHEEWLHKLGNLTLLANAKNAGAGNRSFDEKKKAYEKSNQKSPFDITKELCDLPEWDLPALQRRHEKMKRALMKLWSVPELL